MMIGGGSEELLILAGARAIVALPAGTPRRIQSRVWAQLKSLEMSTETVVQSIPLLGDDAVDSFSVVVADRERDGGPSSITVVVRGLAAVDVHSEGGSARVSAQGLVPWHLVTFGSVGAVAVGTLPEISSTATSLAEAGVNIGAGTLRGRRGIWQIDSTFSLPNSELRVAAREVVDASAFEATRLVTPQTDASFSLLASSEVAFQRPGPPTNRPGRQFELRIGSGAPIELLNPVVVGRNPQPPRISGGTARKLLRVESESSQVSGSHVEIARVGASVVVTDLSSTNGTTVTLPDGSRIKLRQGDSLVTPVQSMIDVGDGNVIEVLEKSV
jgi:hypothetical protein